MRQHWWVSALHSAAVLVACIGEDAGMRVTGSRPFLALGQEMERVTR